MVSDMKKDKDSDVKKFKNSDLKQYMDSEVYKKQSVSDANVNLELVLSRSN